MIYKFFKKLFPTEIYGTQEMNLNIETVKESIKRIAGKHLLKEDGDNIKIIPTGALNPFGIAFPIKNYRELNFKLSSKSEDITNIEYSAIRKFSKSTSIIYTIFFILDLLCLITMIYFFVNGEQYIASVIAAFSVSWIIITIIAFLFDYFVLLSGKAIKRSFSNNILRRINRLGKNIAKV